MTRLPRDSDGDPVEPAANGFARTHVGRPPREHHERRLECVLGTFPGDPSANAQDHRPEPTDQLREHGVVAGLDEPTKELPIVGFVGWSGNSPRRAADGGGQDGVGHENLRERTTVIRYPSWGEVVGRVAGKMKTLPDAGWMRATLSFDQGARMEGQGDQVMQQGDQWG